MYDSLNYSINENYSLSDITAVYAVRATEYNPWVIERVNLIKNYYNDLPHVLIVDFGSEDEYSSQIKNICQNNGFEYQYISDSGVFSAAIARNIGFSFVKTKLVFFNDIDCFSGPDLFCNLVNAANDFELSKYFDRMINLPVYHLTEDVTEKIQNSLEVDKKIISKSINNSIFTRRWKDCEFVAPYSNVFLCRFDLFNYLGGYDERFRGHGSEDFEFLIRYSIYSSRFPLPAELDKDFYAPTRESFYKDSKRYKGFRRIFEALSFEAETYGLRVAHLYHPKPEEMSWVKTNDWKRDAFTEATSAYLNNRKELVNLDWLPRNKRVLALVKHDDHFNYLFVLRNAGYKIDYFDMEKKENQINVIKRIDAGFYDAVCMFNPYMKSHTDLYLYFSYAKNKGVRPIVIERGALPESWYYAEDMAYADSDYDRLNISEVVIEDQSLIESFFERIKSGNFTLESNGSFDETFYKYRLLLSVVDKKKVFIPLQLSDDSAVTLFVGNLKSYEDYIENLREVFNENKDLLFLVKKHPLSKLSDFQDDLPDNVVICDDSDNIHALIEISDAVICYNSGVGLLALMHRKPVFTVGRSFYSKSHYGLATAVSLPEDAVTIIKSGGGAQQGDIEKFIYWLITKKYSFYKSVSVIRDFGDRKSHGYKSSKFYLVNYDGFSLKSKNLAEDHSFSLISYGAAKLNISLGIDQHQKDLAGKSSKPVTSPVSNVSLAPEPGAKKIVRPTSELANKNPNSSRKIRKLLRNPKGFFGDSKNPILKKMSALF